MEFLDPKKIKIEKSSGRSISLTTEGGKRHKNVHFLLLFPFTDLDNFISAVVKKGSEQEEIGIIPSIRKLPKKAAKIVRDDLNVRYFIPEIKDIEKILDKYWFFVVYAVTDRGRKKFYLGAVRENVRFKADSSIVITDLEKCRYKVPRLDRLPAKGRAELERILM